MAKMMGIDVSGWNQTNDIDKANPSFLIVKATEGVGYKSDGLYNHVNAWRTRCAVTGFRPYTGFYHYARPDYGNTPEAEVDWFMHTINAIPGVWGLYPIFALDWEGAALSYGPTWAYKFLTALKKKIPGTPFIYMSSSVTRAYDWSKVAGIARLWVAAYCNIETDTPDIRHWKHYSMWQYTDTPYDKDFFMSSGVAWENLSGTAKQSETGKQWKVTSSTDDKIILERV